jgi:predicted nuclease with TOPRIM domain
MVGQIKETKMAIENELEDMRELKKELTKLNEHSKKDADKVDERISKIKNRLSVLKAINEEQIQVFMNDKADNIIGGGGESPKNILKTQMWK